MPDKLPYADIGRRSVVAEEMETASRLSRAATATDGVSRDFAGGVYDTLAWALATRDRQPGPPV